MFVEALTSARDLRMKLKATELGLQMHPMSQAREEFAEVVPHS